MPISQRISSFDSVEEIGAAISIVEKKLRGPMDELRELRRELVLHRAEDAEREVYESLTSMEYSMRKLARTAASIAEGTES
jgi:hypothetical protein